MSISIFKMSRSQFLGVTLATTLPLVSPILNAEQVLQEVLPSSQQELQEVLPSSQQELQEKPVSRPRQLQERPKPKQKKVRKQKKRPTPKQKHTPRPANTPTPSSTDSVEEMIRRAKGGGKQTSPISPRFSPQSTASTVPVADSQVARLLSSLGITATPEAVSGSDPSSVKQAISRLEASYNLSPEILNLRDQVPPNPESIIRHLNLHPVPTTTSKTDLSDRTPTVEEIIRALQLR